MNTSKNKPLPFAKNKFFNISKGKKENGYTFIFPTICISPKKNLHWGMSLFSIYLGFSKYFLQFNICEITRDNNTVILKEDAANILNMLKENSLGVDPEKMADFFNFIKNNKHIITISKNSDLQHPYIQIILISYIQNQDFIIDKSDKTNNNTFFD